ncbi:hypothetical protein ACLPHM_05950 [Paenalcaligenes sp. Me131]|uniref:hypothetical protein n=1 Tax=Paenalcaligenes sp. Me131 TaxID=3392636 RepID=UPI003D2A5186
MTQMIPTKLTGKQLADEGIALAQSHAEFVTPNWGERIMSLFEAWVRKQDEQFTITHFRLYVAEHHPDLVPPSSNAWGAVGRLAQRRGLVRITGSMPSICRYTKGHSVRTYVRAV